MCDCIKTTNEALEEKHNSILVTNMFGKPERCTIGTAVLRPKRGARPVIMLATFCPFCGEKYAKEAA